MHSRLVSWSRMLYLAGIVLALVLVIPTAWFPFQLAKVAVFTLVLAVAAILFVVGGGAKELMRSHGFYLALAIAGLPLAYLLSAAFSTDRSLAFAGVGVESDTVLFVTIASIAFLFSFVQFRTLRMVRLLTTVVFWSLIAASVFQLVTILFGTSVIPFQAFSDRSVNLIGKWNDLGILVGLLGMFFLVALEMSNLNTVKKTLSIIGLVVSAILLGIINFSLVWVFVLVFSIGLGVLKFFMHRKGAEEGEKKHWTALVPWYAVSGIVIGAFFLLFGSVFNTAITSIFPVSSLEVRPSLSSTLAVLNNSRGGNFSRIIVGSGPNTFGLDWLKAKPSEVNQSLFWNLDFNVGFSTFITALGTVGIIGMIAWLIPLALVIFALVRVVRLSVLSREEKIAGAIIGVASLFLLGTILFYVPSPNLILLAFTLAGAAFGFFWRQGQSAPEGDENMPKVRKIASLAVMVVVLVLAVVSGFVVNRRFISEIFTQQGQYALSQQHIDDALALAARAQAVDRDRNNMELAVDAGNLKLQQIAADTKTPSSQLQQIFASQLTATVNAGKAAVQMYPSDYHQSLALARVYDYLSTLKIQGAYDSAKQAYLAAATENPTNPQIALALARLEAGQNNMTAAQQDISSALTLKPNYTDAILFVVQLDVANNDIPNAVRAATAATQTAPGVAPIWFELGLLYYAGGDTKDAILPLEKAITIQPDYANAKYFLGLAYYDQKRTAEALKQFQDLKSTNPDNTEIDLILSNMQADKPPFQSAQAPITAHPETRANAPLPQ